MTLNALLGRAKAPTPPRDDLPIGELDASIVHCPVCARPLDARARRCPGCRTTFLFGVPTYKTGLLVSIGLAFGLLIGGGSVAIYDATRAAAAAQVPNVVPSALPVASDAVGPTDPPAVTPAPAPDVPPAALAALRGTATVNARLVATGQAISAELAREDYDPGVLATLFRRITAESTAGADLMPRLVTWSAAGPVAASLDTVYAQLRAEATDGLKASLSSRAAYRQAGWRILGALGALPKIDAASRELATQVGTELPVVHP